MDRRTRVRALVLIVGVWLWHGGEVAISQSVRASVGEAEHGVVWTPPSSSPAAQGALRRIQGMGATAVRLTRPVDDPEVLTLADTLGLSLYVDLPVAYLSAGALADTVAFARRQVDRVLAHAQQHSSLRAIGLARAADTTTPHACSYFEALAQYVRSRSRLQTYYVTPFQPSTDACGVHVDEVLLDVVDASDPLDRWNQGEQTHAAVGVGAVGRGVRPGAGEGLHVPHSPERQARYLERFLPSLLERAGGSVLFVYRWRDRTEGGTMRHYGLHSEDGRRRPAARVVEGIFTGRQTTFAFPQGTAPATGAPWLVVIGWGLVAGLGGLYAQYGRVRRTLGRYFLSHEFYRDSVRRGRDLMPEVSVVLLVSAMCALGIGAMVVVRALATEPSMRHVLVVLPDALRLVATRWITAPVTYGVEVGVGGGLLLSAWGLGLGAAARPWGGISSSQVLMLMAWPQWPALFGMGAALVLAVQGVDAHGGRIAATLAGTGFLLSAWITIRVLWDYVAVSDVPWPAAWGLFLVSPPVVLLIGTGGMVLHYDIPLGFFYRLMALT